MIFISVGVSVNVIPVVNQGIKSSYAKWASLTKNWLGPPKFLVKTRCFRKCAKK